jgi:DNA-binding transcriptional MerR regulator
MTNAEHAENRPDGAALSTAALLELQESDRTVTPTAALEELRARGRKVTKRTLSFWQEQGLLPPALRVGARGGVYPEIVEELIDWIAECRDRGVKVDVIRELLPMWRYLMAAQSTGVVELAAVEHHARRSGLSREANYLVPILVTYLTAGLCSDCRCDVDWHFKDGSVRNAASGPINLGFLIAELDPAGGEPQFIAWTQLTLPGIDTTPDLEDPALIVLGLPVGIALRGTRTPAGGTTRRTSRRGPRCSRRARKQQEVLTLDQA